MIHTILGAIHVLLQSCISEKILCFPWLFQDIFNSVIAALFLLVVCLFAVIIKTNNGTLAGGVSRSITDEFQFLKWM